MRYGSDLVRLTLTFHDWFQQTRMRPCDWWVCSPHSTNTAEITLSSVKLSFIKWGSLLSHITWYSLQHCNEKICFMRLFRLSYMFHYSHFVSSMNQRGASFWKQVLMFLIVVSAPVNNAHWESTAYARMQSTSLALPIYNPINNSHSLWLEHLLFAISCHKYHVPKTVMI